VLNHQFLIFRVRENQEIFVLDSSHDEFTNLFRRNLSLYVGREIEPTWVVDADRANVLTYVLWTPVQGTKRRLQYLLAGG
jgi:hypothetical protein